ncbi:sulfate/thiosulfate transporter subunit [Enterobacter cancerogenus]|uniref:Sulfate/thiosulfate transporter subunit n=1 Tax=Enterobacter cancerogenus TaxID=69218 RepID=A0A484Z832_9ENTR|nr:sulfate/thiosulfate transporter subunit [Enterobacter cancerogenus]
MPATVRVGFVFQHYALFRHMTVFDNIAFGLTVLAAVANVPMRQPSKRK